MTVKEQVIDIASQHLGVGKEDIAIDDNLMDDLGATSLEVADLIGKFEEHFSIKIPKDQLSRLTTIRDFADQIADQIGEFE